jgi:beta-lactamase superfamily II metal-dependent hydrolase
MPVTVKTYPAKNGDCFLISYERDTYSEDHILIDCGYKDTVENYLIKDLNCIGIKGEVIKKMILTHIDSDHILGAIYLLEKNNTHNFIQIEEVWHNTFRHISTEGNSTLNQEQEKIIQRIIQRGYPVTEDKKEQTISAKQGTTVGALILKGGYSWNSAFNEKAVSINHKREILIEDDLKIALLSPNQEKLNALEKLWKKELKKYGINYEEATSDSYDDTFEMLVSWDNKTSTKKPKTISSTKETIKELLRRPFEEDTTPTNGSSIAFILSIKDNELLFLADAHPDLIVSSLEEYQEEEVILFDLIKVAHHGSFKNINQALLEKVDAPNYLISTNGSGHNHPDKETIAHIVSRPTTFQRKLYFNYITDNSEHFNRVEWMEEYNYSIHYLNQAPYKLTL